MAELASFHESDSLDAVQTSIALLKPELKVQMKFLLYISSWSIHWILNNKVVLKKTKVLEQME